MRHIYVATKARRFLQNLFTSSIGDFQFNWKQDNVYEVNSNLKLMLSKLVRSKVGDHLGFIQRVRVSRNDFDVGFSYNRFLNIDKKYIICLENPTALFHYSLGRNETLVGRRKIRKYLNDAKLKSIVCISKACYDTINNFYDIPNSVKVTQIYPLVPSNPAINVKLIQEKSHRSSLNCLYVSSNFELKGGRDIIECFKRLRDNGLNDIFLRIITRKDSLNAELQNALSKLGNVKVYDFNLNKVELQEIYSDNNILLNPSRQDSFPLVVLEAIKAGNVVLSTDLYAIPEMVENHYNGFLTGPRYRFFDYNNMPNPNVWNNRDETIYSRYVDDHVVNFLYEKIEYLNMNRKELERLSINAFVKSTTGAFSSDYIQDRWLNLLNEIS